MRLGGWRRVAIGLLPLALALVLAFVQYRGLLSGSDALVFDALTLEQAGRSPAVVIVQSDPLFEQRGVGRQAELARAALALGARRVAFRQDPGIDPARDGIAAGRVVVARAIEKVPGRPAWRFAGAAPAPGIVAGARVLAPAVQGLHRRQLAWLPGETGRIPVFEAAAVWVAGVHNPYWLRLSRRQNLPQIEASQLLSGAVDAAALAGLVVLVEPPEGKYRAHVATPRSPGSQAGTLGEYNALAIQTLATRRGVRALDPLESALLLIAAALLSGLLYLRSDPKRVMPLLLIASLAGIAGGTWLALELANLLLPVTALALAQPLTALLVLHRAELSEDRNLRRFVTQTINLSSRQVLLKDLARLPDFLARSSPLLGICRSLLLEARGGMLEELEADNASVDELAADRRLLRSLLRRARRSSQPIDAAVLAPGWPGTVRLAALGPAQGEVYWLYGFDPGKDHSAALHAAAAMAGDYRAIQQLRADLSAGSDSGREYRPADEWAGGAVQLIADHGDQVSTGLDGLETAVMVFHPIGFPIHANAPMVQLYETLGLSLGETALPALLGALTTLDPVRISAIVNDLLLHGGEMRVDAREIDTRVRQVRVAAAQDAASGRSCTLVVEAVDISEPRRLAQLRLSLSNLLDVSIRNDLEAIGFALATARSGHLPPEQLEKALGQIAKAADRATGRLDEMAPHLHPVAGAAISQCFPIDAVAAVGEAWDLVRPLARELNVPIDGERPAIVGFTLADPRLLTEMVEAMLRIVLADSAPGEQVLLDLAEEDKRTRVTIAGGIGMSFERLYAALENSKGQAPGPFRSISQGMAAAMGWGAAVSYSSRVGKGYRFVIEMRRIG